MKPARFLQEAESEFLEQVSYYEGEQPGLGKRFYSAVVAATAIASASPGIGAPWKLGTRRVFPKGFPFSVVYREEPAEIVVYAIAHFRRRPTFWRQRRSGEG